MRLRKARPLDGLRALGGKVITGSKVRLREKKLSDVRTDYAWQSDTELVRLDAAPLLTASFPFYLLDYTDQLRLPAPHRYPLAVETLDGRFIGNCTCYDIDENKGEAQLGIMIGDRAYWDRGYGADTVRTVVNHVFMNTELRRIYLKTLDWNVRAQRCFAKCGFMACGQMKRNGHDFVLMELTREQWNKQPEHGAADS
ncbi:MAG: GNAT family protein [Chloroflexota bacterium]